MTTKTKCTISICLLFIVEIFPLPFSAFLGIYIVRKRPKWFPNVVDRLYADVTFDQPDDLMDNVDAMKTRSRCTYSLSGMTVLDLALPVTIPTALYVVRRRPRWFRNVVTRLYSDLAPPPAQIISDTVPVELTDVVGQLDTRPEVAAVQLKKQLELERDSISFANFAAERSTRKTQPTDNEKEVNENKP